MDGWIKLIKKYIIVPKMKKSNSMFSKQENGTEILIN